jgi:hypothetical protein
MVRAGPRGSNYEVRRETERRGQCVSGGAIGRVVTRVRGRARPRRNLRDTQSQTRRASTVGNRRAAFIVEEAVTVTEDESYQGACTLGDLVRRQPVLGLDVHADVASDRLVQHAHRSHDSERRGVEWFGQLGGRRSRAAAPASV